MQELTSYQIATEAAKLIVEMCVTQEDSERILDLVSKLIKLRWSIALKQS